MTGKLFVNELLDLARCTACRSDPVKWSCDVVVHLKEFLNMTSDSAECCCKTLEHGGRSDWFLHEETDKFKPLEVVK